MASDNYNPYNYPYQQSSAQQYSGYQSAPASDHVAQPPRRYQHPPTMPGNDYMSYQGQSYGGQGSGYGPAQDSSWTGSSYGGAGETTRGAAEVLRNMSNNAYTPNSTTAAQSGFTATSHTARYSTGNSNSPRMQPQQAQGNNTGYGQPHNRPHSVNTDRAQHTASKGLPSPAPAAGYPSQRGQSIHNGQQQRSASPAHHRYSNSPAPTSSTTRNTAMTAAAPQQYTDYDRSQLATVEASRTIQGAAPPTSYDYGSAPTVAPPGPIAPPSSSAADNYTAQGSITVNPLAVYDPWPEYQRKQAALRAQKAVEDAELVEEERAAENTRKAEEAKSNEERNSQEPSLMGKQSKQKGKEAQEQTNPVEADSAAPNAAAGSGDALEMEIRAMMAKMRELNSKDPALLARIWEEERRAKATLKFQSVQSKTTPQATVAAPAQAVLPNSAQAANQRRKAAPKEISNATIQKAVTPLPAPTAFARSQTGAQGTRQSGNTIWPPEKKTQLASAAAEYLKFQNPTSHIDAVRVLNILDGNPSYIDLCQQLENMGLRLDRAAFAKNLLTAVPDVNSSSRKPAPQPVPVQRPQVPAAVMKKEIATPASASPAFPQAATTPASRLYRSLPNNASQVATPVHMAEMIPIKPSLKPPANKEEAARKRNLSELVDLTLLDEEENMGPPPKRANVDAMYPYGSPQPHLNEDMIVDSEPSNFPIANNPSCTVHEPNPKAAPLIDREIRYRTVVEPLDKRKALRRNNYNPATIARDVLLACGRHPSERQLNQHLDVLRSNLPFIGFDSDLTTIKWEVLDPGNPPPGYFKDSVQALTEDADDEDDSEDGRDARPQAQSNAVVGESGVQERVQALPEAVNPFQKKKRGRPPRHSLPNSTTPSTPQRSLSPTNMSASAPRPSAASVGYSAFRSATEHGPDGQPLPKKKGRPVGWRKAIHGSAAAQAKSVTNNHAGPFNKHQPPQPSSLRNVRVGGEEVIRLDSQSPSVANRVPSYRSYKCKWQNCTAELHNLETLTKHVFKVHRKETPRNTPECLWGDCGKEVTNFDPNMNMRIEKHTPYAFDLESNWRAHIRHNHFDPLSWEFGDGPTSGVSDAHDSEAYLSDAQGRQVTPRIIVDRDHVDDEDMSPNIPVSTRRGRGRPPKDAQEKEALEALKRLVSYKRRIGGPGMDRGGATLVNDKRRKGFIDDDGTEEELVDAED